MISEQFKVYLAYLIGGIYEVAIFGDTFTGIEELSFVQEDHIDAAS